MQTKAVVFDKDGTVLDYDAFWLPVSILATEKILAAIGASDVPCDDMMTALGVENGVTAIDSPICCGTYGQIADRMAEILLGYGHRCDMERLTAVTVEAYLSSTFVGKVSPTCPELQTVLAQLKARGTVLALVTADGPDMTAHCLRELGIEPYFDVVYTDDGTHPNKPDPWCINDLCGRYGLTREQVVMVGDTLTDLHFARNSGVRAVGLAKNEKNRSILLSMTDTVLPDVSRLPEVLP